MRGHQREMVDNGLLVECLDEIERLNALVDERAAYDALVEEAVEGVRMRYELARLKVST